MILEYSGRPLELKNSILKSHYAIRINVHLPFVIITEVLVGNQSGKILQEEIVVLEHSRRFVSLQDTLDA